MSECVCPAATLPNHHLPRCDAGSTVGTSPGWKEVEGDVDGRIMFDDGAVDAVALLCYDDDDVNLSQMPLFVLLLRIGLDGRLADTN